MYQRVTGSGPTARPRAIAGSVRPAPAGGTRGSAGTLTARSPRSCPSLVIAKVHELTFVKPASVGLD